MPHDLGPIFDPPSTPHPPCPQNLSFPPSPVPSLPSVPGGLLPILGVRVRGQRRRAHGVPGRLRGWREWRGVGRVRQRHSGGATSRWALWWGC